MSFYWVLELLLLLLLLLLLDPPPPPEKLELLPPLLQPAIAKIPINPTERSQRMNISLPEMVLVGPSTVSEGGLLAV